MYCVWEYSCTPPNVGWHGPQILRPWKALAAARRARHRPKGRGPRPGAAARGLLAGASAGGTALVRGAPAAHFPLRKRADPLGGRPSPPARLSPAPRCLPIPPRPAGARGPFNPSASWHSQGQQRPRPRARGVALAHPF